MAKVQMKMPEDFLMKVSRLADKTDEIIPKVLEAGAEVVEDKVRSNLHSVIGSGTKYDSRSTGELLRSLGTSPALQDRNGDFDIKVGFPSLVRTATAMPRSPPSWNTEKGDQPAKPFLKPARSASKNRLYQRHEGKAGRGGGEHLSLLSELKTVIETVGLPVETGVFSDEPPDEYVVVTPLADTYELHADNLPEYETQEARLSLFSRGSYLKRKKQLSKALLAADFTITDRRYIGHEDDTGYHHYAIDVAKTYETEE